MFLQIIDPDAFGGVDQFCRQTDWLAAACHAATPRPGVESVRLPGERAIAMFNGQQKGGVELYPGILEGLRPWAERLGVTSPKPVEA